MALCRSCASEKLDLILSLGRMPLANSLLRAEDLAKAEPVFPLDLVFCPQCTLVQITQTVSREELFSHYLYLSSFSQTMLAHSQELAECLIRERKLDGDSLVIEIGSNDGYLLQYYRQAGIPVLGIEPAANIAAVAESRGIPTWVRFFGRELAQELSIQADVIHANNVLAHVVDLGGFIAGLARVVKADGIIVIEVPHLKCMIEHLEFDTIYHEHLCYFSLSALQPLFRRHGLEITDVFEIPLHGGSLQIHAMRMLNPALRGQAVSGGEASDRVSRLLEEERAAGMGSHQYYQQFGEAVRELKSQLLAQLAGLKASGSRIAAYGASAKGSMLLNYCGIGRETLDFVVDRSTLKQGLYTPGTHLLIRPPEALLTEAPDQVLLLTWNFAAEIIRQQEEYCRRGGEFIFDPRWHNSRHRVSRGH